MTTLAELQRLAAREPGFAMLSDANAFTSDQATKLKALVSGDGALTAGEIVAIRALIGVVPANTLYVGSSPLLVNGSYLRVA